MTLRVVGAGLGRTGTSSLKAALEQLLGGTAYHMSELFRRPDHVPLWTAAAEGDASAAVRAVEGFTAAVDWPAAAFWPALAAENPGAVILLSTRESSAAWWRSARTTIFANLVEPVDEWKARHPEGAPWRDMWEVLAARTFTPDYLDQASAMAAYEKHNERVRATADPNRLVEWQPGDGWPPLCRALDVPVPNAPFPHLNSSEEWLSRRS